ncbi:MAG: carbamoyltransferase, partial [Deltaproteobacteria bacterium]|nr:carbamoyltransferase [Deltaproteobacteria bacterium]
MTTYILGISAYYHDSAGCLLRDGEIIAAAQEERFTRKKFDARFPGNAVTYCLTAGNISLKDLKYVVFYDKPLIKFERLLETYVAFSPKGIQSFLAAMPVWLKEKLLLKSVLGNELGSLNGAKKSELPQLLFNEHHESHAASAFYPSPFTSSAVLCMDGVGEWATTSAWFGNGNELKPLWEIHFPHSLGLLYSAFTYYTGFRVNSGEYKVMGLAPYGKPKYVKAIYDNLIDLKEDGTFRLKIDYFNYCTGLTMTNGKFDDLFGGPPRKPESKLTQREMDLASSIQQVTEEVMLRLVQSLHRETGSENLCMAGGVALNCVGNGRILREGPFKGLWVQPSAGDAGGALGAALTAWHRLENKPRELNGSRDRMRGSFLGPAYTNDEIEDFLKKKDAPYERISDDVLFNHIAEEIAQGKVVGWVQDRMEFGPRTLGARSILGDPRNPKMQSVMNLKIKYRESFRPFAPSVLRERVADYFALDTDSPYMLLVAPVLEKRRTPITKEQEALWGIDLLNVPKSDIPAVTHVDYSARIQTVHKDTNPRYYALLKAFEAKTGCGVLVNTSFNVRNEPIVCSPEDAYRCFMRSAIDILVLENCVLY